MASRPKVSIQSLPPGAADVAYETMNTSASQHLAPHTCTSPMSGGGCLLGSSDGQAMEPTFGGPASAAHFDLLLTSKPNSVPAANAATATAKICRWPRSGAFFLDDCLETAPC